MAQPDVAQPGSNVLPLRPLTVGELLDAAVGLLRSNARALLAVAVGLAIAEQAVLYPLRNLAEVRPPAYFPPYSDRLAEYWAMIGVGYLTEGMIIALLGGLAARAAAAAITGQRLPARSLLSPKRARFGSIALVAVLIGIGYGLASLSCWIPWIVAYGLLGLAIPAIVIDGKGPIGALGRSVVLSCRNGLRAGWIRLVGYLGWLAIRAALGFGGIAALELVLPDSQDWLTVISMVVWFGVNSVAYATLACLDAVVHLETRMRTEGLDIVAFRARRQGLPIPLAVP